MATIACVPTTATKDNTCVRVDAAGLTVNDSAAFSASIYPTEPQILYYIEATGSGGTTLTSERFGGPAFSVQCWMFDAAATYTVAVKKDSDDSTVASTTIVVS